MFSESAHLYDAIYTRMKNYEEEANTVRSWIQRLRPGAKTVLDVACGTGEHSKFLKSSYRIDGIDLNQDFLAIARAKNPDGRYTEADMSAFELKRKYDVVICLFSSIGYVATNEKLRKTIACFAKHLNPAGVMIVEPWFTPEVWSPGRPNMATVSEDRLKICRMSYNETRESRLSYLRFHYLVGTPESVTHFTEEHLLGLFSVDEMKSAFTDNGLNVQYDEKGLFGRGLYLAESRS